jgi:hypothetical protein
MDRTWGDELLLYAIGRALHVTPHIILHGRDSNVAAGPYPEEEDFYVAYVHGNHYIPVVPQGQVEFTSEVEVQVAEERVDEEMIEAGVALVYEHQALVVRGLPDDDEVADEGEGGQGAGEEGVMERGGEGKKRGKS